MQFKYHFLKRKWYFFVQDVVEILTKGTDIKQYTKKMVGHDNKLKSNRGTICTLIKMLADIRW